MAPADGTNTRAATLSEVDLLKAENGNLARKLEEAERREGDWHAVADCRSEEIMRLQQQLEEAERRYAFMEEEARIAKEMTAQLQQRLDDALEDFTGLTEGNNLEISRLRLNLDQVRKCLRRLVANNEDGQCLFSQAKAALENSK